MTTLRSYLDSLFSGGGQRLVDSIELWKQGVDNEVQFWTGWFETKGLSWPEDYETRLKPKQYLPFLASLLPPTEGAAEILDVGAGPITVSGSFLPDRPINVTAVDPLAHQYSRVIDRFGVTPPVKTRFSFAEDVSSRFKENSFDLVTCTNALDHAIEPVWGIIEMMMVAKKNAHVVLSHRQNEAEFEQYSGFHQWNFDCQGDDFVIWKPGTSINVTRMLNGVAEIRLIIVSDQISAIIKKSDDFPVSALEYHKNIRAGMLEAFLNVRS